MSGLHHGRLYAATVLNAVGKSPARYQACVTLLHTPLSRDVGLAEELCCKAAATPSHHQYPRQRHMHHIHSFCNGKCWQMHCQFGLIPPCPNSRCTGISASYHHARTVQHNSENIMLMVQAKFIERAQALLHGDLHTGSLMCTQDTTYMIDAEFAFYGPIAFDVQKMIANLLIAYCASFGLESADEPRNQQRAWMLQVLSLLWGGGSKNRLCMACMLDTRPTFFKQHTIQRGF